jgi:ceramide glucosyltransferase
MTILLVVFYFFAAISIYLGILSLRGGIRFARHLHSERGRQYPDFTPFVSVFLPVRGIDDELEKNIAAVVSQNYPGYEVMFISDSDHDSAWPIVEQARQSIKGKSAPSIKKLIAGPATDRGQKVHNLSVAIGHADPTSDIFVFVDSDARVSPNWLRSLVAPLQDEGVGATTGYRWFISVRGGFSSHLRSVWNAAIASALGAGEKKNFCWGGSTAISRSTFDSCRVLEHWYGTVSDDFAVTRALHAAGLPVRFVPQCLTPSFDDCSARELLEFTTRQLKITRTYATHLWKAVLFGSIIFVITFFGGLGLVVARAAMHFSVCLPMALLLIIFAMGAAKSYVRLRAVAGIIHEARANTPIAILAHVTLWPLASALYLYNGLAAAFSQRIKWRGIAYELKSPPEAVIIEHQTSEVRNRKPA